MVTEDEVRSYGYHRQVFADGRNALGKFATQASACRQNPRVLVYWNSQTGQRFFIDDIELLNPTPATIAKRLNTQGPKVITALEITELVARDGMMAAICCNCSP
jgi:hypothetical protein